MFEKLMQPIKIGTTESSNRIFMPAMGTLFSYDQKLNDRHYDFYERRAKGGAGIITAGPVGVDFLGAGAIALTLANDDVIGDYKELAQRIQKHGSKAFVQLFHAGRYSFSMTIGGEQAMAPSAVKSRYTNETPREMTLEDIQEVQDAFAQAARRAREAGIDGVEIIGSAGYLISQFLSPLSNKREDQYGGSFENRVRFPVETIQKVRAAVGDDFTVTIRVAGNDFVQGGNTNDDSAVICQEFEKAGVDGINVTGGWHETFVSQLTMEVPRGGYAYLAAGIRKAVNIPVISSNRITDPFVAEEILKDGMADMVALGRVLIADPDWPLKVKEGRPEVIRPCIGCMQGCMDMIFTGQPLCCLVNPEAGYEGDRLIEKTSSPKKVMVVGGGAGGLEAARVAAESGHEVTLYEKDIELGGQLWLAGAPPGRDEFLALIDYFLFSLAETSIEVETGVEVTVDLVKQENPDVVIVAEGASQLVPPIKGLDKPILTKSWDLLKDDPELGDKVAVIGGGAVGLETALLIAKKGTINPEVLEFLLFNRAESDEKLHELVSRGTKEVTVIEMLPRIGQDVGKSSRWVLLKGLKDRGVKVKTNTKVLEILENGLAVETDGEQKALEFDSIVLAVGSKSNKELSDALTEAGIDHKKVGDCVSPRKVMDAIHEAFLAIKELG